LGTARQKGQQTSTKEEARGEKTGGRRNPRERENGYTKRRCRQVVKEGKARKSDNEKSPDGGEMNGNTERGSQRETQQRIKARGKNERRGGGEVFPNFGSGKRITLR